jgi:hypothetical protein
MLAAFVIRYPGQWWWYAIFAAVLVVLWLALLLAVYLRNRP